MRVLMREELRFVSGAGKSSCYNPCYDPCSSKDKSKKTKGNNGYGNGGNDGVPGRSGKQDSTR